MYSKFIMTIICIITTIINIVNNAINIMCQKQKMRTPRLFKWEEMTTLHREREVWHHTCAAEDALTCSHVVMSFRIFTDITVTHRDSFRFH